MCCRLGHFILPALGSAHLFVTKGASASDVHCAGAYVQRIWAAGAVSQGLGEERLQGGQVGQESVQVWRLQHPDMTWCMTVLPDTLML